MTARTLYDKLWDDHVVHTEEDGTSVLYIDRHLVHEVTSPQAFEGLRLAGRKVWRTSSIVATADHNTPTTGWERGYDGIADPTSKQQVVTLDANIKAFGAAAYFPFLDKRQGIVHVIGPEQGATLPGMTVVCGDSHTSTHGAFGALAHGIGTSEVEHVMATQTLLAKKAKNLLVKVEGTLQRGVTAKDIVLAIIGRIGTAGGTGYTIEFAGSAIRALSMEGRMTVCNMAIEAGARAGLVARRRQDHRLTSRAGPSRPPASSGTRRWPTGARCSPTPVRTSMPWSSSTRRRSARRSPGAPRPRWCCRSRTACPTPTRRRTPSSAAPSSARWPTWAWSRTSRWPTCSSTRCSSARAPTAASRTCATPPRWCASVGGKVAANVKLAMVVPGSGLVKAQAEAEGLDKVFKAAGFEWREPGCSMCLAMNADRLEPGERCASTSNRNFEGRQGDWRTHAPGQPGHGRGRRAAGPFRRRAPPRLNEEPPHEDAVRLPRRAGAAGRLQHHRRHGQGHLECR